LFSVLIDLIALHCIANGEERKHMGRLGGNVALVVFVRLRGRQNHKSGRKKKENPQGTDGCARLATAGRKEEGETAPRAYN
jgi:hypothetical protein